MKSQLAAGKSCKRMSKNPTANNNLSLLCDSTKDFHTPNLSYLHNKLGVIGGVLIQVSQMRKLRLSDLSKVT